LRSAVAPHAFHLRRHLGLGTSSFVVMQKNKLIKALTTDPHFEQAGFVRLLKR
jgi:predicted nucleic acid-binding protein